MGNVTIQKRGKYYQYKFEVAKVDGKRKFINNGNRNGYSFYGNDLY